MSGILGQEQVLTPLLNAARNGRLHNCYLFEGPQGVGKKKAAQMVARAAACTAEDLSVRPCDTCQTCRHMLKGSHPDLVEIGPDEGKRTITIGVASAREVIRQTRMHRYAARRRTFIFDPADRLRPEAANALLKTLEEPPDGTGFILVTDRASSLLPTVLSRSQRVRFRLLTEAHLVQDLQSRGIANAKRIARLADGRPGRAQALADGELEALDEARSTLLEVLAGSPKDLFSFSESLTKGNKLGRIGWQPTVERYLNILESLLRDAACSGLGKTDFLNGDKLDLVQTWSKALFPHGIERLQAEITKTRDRMELNVNARLLVEPLFAQVASELGKSRQHP
jgi:DNA polymerase III subunit delta'